jgi:hypothetical protein
MANLTLRTVFPAEVDTSALRLTSRKVWVVGTTSPATKKNEHKSIIRRPPGEPGKPNDGGFALKPYLGWSSDTYKAVRASFLLALSFWGEDDNLHRQKFVRMQANLHLDTRFPLTAQNNVALERVYRLVSRHYPRLKIVLDLKAG